MPGKKARDKTDSASRRASGWEVLTGQTERIEAYCGEYRTFISQAKTEREVVSYLAHQLTGKRRIQLYENRGKALALCRRGIAPLKEGVRLVIAHIDCPRLDLKVNPLYEDTHLAMLKTHYYGGIKKYQWLARPLALHGVVIREDGSVVQVVLGEDPDDTCLTIEDLLPHLAAKAQYTKKVGEAFTGEKKIVAGSLVCACKH